MMRIPHELRDEFSQETQLVERLIKSDHEFGRLAASYEEINHEIYRIEPEETPTTEEVLETLKNAVSCSKIKSPPSLGGRVSNQALGANAEGATPLAPPEPTRLRR